MADPPVRSTDPPVNVRLPKVVFDSNVPPVTVDRPVTVPPVRVEVPLVVVRLLSVPPVRFRVPDVVVLPVTVPPIISAVPLLLTFKLERVVFDENEPPVTFDKPATDPPVRVVVPFVVVRLLRVPLVKFKVPADTVAPVTVPPVKFAVP